MVCICMAGKVKSCELKILKEIGRMFLTFKRISLL